MKKFMGTLSRRTTNNENVTSTEENGPEATASNGVKLFCESGSPENSGDEVLHLPGIVESAESSPAAAKAAANRLRKFLSTDNLSRAHTQYNAVMLIRILADNPGPTFTRNLDAKFVTAVKELLRNSRDPSVQQILREALDAFESEKKDDEGLAPLLRMWTKEKENAQKHGSKSRRGYPPQGYGFQPQALQQENYFARNHKDRGQLPPPTELVSRIEEAKTSAKLLQQVVQSTPSTELLGNDLVKEFGDRCQSASRSIQSYINATDPAPDEDTLLTLIETNDQLSVTVSNYQRALLKARKTLSSQPESPEPNPQSEQTVLSVPPIPQNKPIQQTKGTNPFGDQFNSDTGADFQKPAFNGDHFSSSTSQQDQQGHQPHVLDVFHPGFSSQGNPGHAQEAHDTSASQQNNYTTYDDLYGDDTPARRNEPLRSREV